LHTLEVSVKILHTLEVIVYRTWSGLPVFVLRLAINVLQLINLVWGEGREEGKDGAGESGRSERENMAGKAFIPVLQRIYSVGTPLAYTRASMLRLLCLDLHLSLRTLPTTQTSFATGAILVLGRARFVFEAER
jgi:hypothetical protein